MYFFLFAVLLLYNLLRQVYLQPTMGDFSRTTRNSLDSLGQSFSGRIVRKRDLLMDSSRSVVSSAVQIGSDNEDDSKQDSESSLSSSDMDAELSINESLFVGGLDGPSEDEGQLESPDQQSELINRFHQITSDHHIYPVTPAHRLLGVLHFYRLCLSEETTARDDWWRFIFGNDKRVRAKFDSLKKQMGITYHSETLGDRFNLYKRAKMAFGDSYHRMLNPISVGKFLKKYIQVAYGISSNHALNKPVCEADIYAALLPSSLESFRERIEGMYLDVAAGVTEVEEHDSFNCPSHSENRVDISTIDIAGHPPTYFIVIHEAFHPTKFVDPYLRSLDCTRFMATPSPDGRNELQRHTRVSSMDSKAKFFYQNNKYVLESQLMEQWETKLLDVLHFYLRYVADHHLAVSGKYPYFNFNPNLLQHFVTRSPDGAYGWHDDLDGCLLNLEDHEEDHPCLPRGIDVQIFTSVWFTSMVERTGSFLEVRNKSDHKVILKKHFGSNVIHAQSVLMNQYLEHRVGITPELKQLMVSEGVARFATSARYAVSPSVVDCDQKYFQSRLDKCNRAIMWDNYDTHKVVSRDGPCTGELFPKSNSNSSLSENSELGSFENERPSGIMTRNNTSPVPPPNPKGTRRSPVKGTTSSTPSSKKSRPPRKRLLSLPTKAPCLPMISVRIRRDTLSPFKYDPDDLPRLPGKFAIVKGLVWEIFTSHQFLRRLIKQRVSLAVNFVIPTNSFDTQASSNVLDSPRKKKCIRTKVSSTDIEVSVMHGIPNNPATGMPYLPGSVLLKSDVFQFHNIALTKGKHHQDICSLQSYNCTGIFVQQSYRNDPGLESLALNLKEGKYPSKPTHVWIGGKGGCGIDSGQVTPSNLEQSRVSNEYHQTVAENQKYDGINKVLLELDNRDGAVCLYVPCSEDGTFLSNGNLTQYCMFIDICGVVGHTYESDKVEDVKKDCKRATSIDHSKYLSFRVAKHFKFHLLLLSSILRSNKEKVDSATPSTFYMESTDTRSVRFALPPGTSCTNLTLPSEQVMDKNRMVDIYFSHQSKPWLAFDASSATEEQEKEISDLGKDVFYRCPDTAVALKALVHLSTAMSLRFMGLHLYGRTLTSCGYLGVYPSGYELDSNPCHALSSLITPILRLKPMPMPVRSYDVTTRWLVEAAREHLRFNVSTTRPVLDLTASHSQEGFGDCLFMSIASRLLGRPAAMQACGKTVDSNVKFFLPTPSTMEKCATFMRSTKAITPWRTTQYKSKVPILNFHDVLDGLMEAGRTIRRTTAGLIVDVFKTEKVKSRSRVFTVVHRLLCECFSVPSDNNGLKFLVSQILADLEEIYNGLFPPLDESECQSTIWYGFGGATGLKICGHGSIYSYYEAFLKTLLETSDDHLSCLGLNRHNDTITVALYGRPFSPVDAEHILCKIYLMLASRSPSRLQNLPWPSSNYTWPLTVIDFWPKSVYGCFKGITDAALRLVKKGEFPELQTPFHVDIKFPPFQTDE